MSFWQALLPAMLAALLGGATAFAAPPAVPALKIVDSPMQSEWSASIERSVGGQAIDGLSFDTGDLAVNLMPAGTELKPFVRIRGGFDRKGWSLSVGEVVLVAPRAANRTFSMVYYPTRNEGTVSFIATGPKGRSQSETIILRAAYDTQIRKVQIRMFDALSLDVGLLSLNCRQSGSEFYRSSNGLVRADFRTQLGASKWDFHALAGTTFLKLSTSNREIAPQLLHGHLQLGRSISAPAARLASAWQLGVRYWNLFPNGADFGFSNLLAPRAGLSLGVQGTKGYKTWIEIAHSPLGSSLSGTVSLDQAATSLRLLHQWPLRNSHRMRVAVEYEDLHFNLDELTRIRLQTGGLSLSYSL